MHSKVPRDHAYYELALYKKRLTRSTERHGRATSLSHMLTIKVAVVSTDGIEPVVVDQTRDKISQVQQVK